MIGNGTIERNKASIGVWMITYNQELHVEQAILSVLEQQCDQPILLIIGDDCSTDKTSVICKKLAAEFPTKIRYERREPNLGMFQNALQTLKDCVEEDYRFIAFLEGDDYWTDKHKLQKQIDAMRQSPSTSLIFTDAMKLVQGELREFHDAVRPQAIFGLKQFITSHYRVPTATVMIRRNVALEIISVLSDVKFKLFHVDYLMWCVAGSFGTMLFLPSKTAVYRVHGASAVRTLAKEESIQRGMELNSFLLEYLGDEYRNHFKGNQWWYYLELAFLRINDKKTCSAFYWLMMALARSIQYGRGNQIQIMKDFVYRFRHPSM